MSVTTADHEEVNEWEHDVHVSRPILCDLWILSKFIEYLFNEKCGDEKKSEYNSAEEHHSVAVHGTQSQLTLAIRLRHECSYSRCEARSDRRANHSDGQGSKSKASK